MYENEDYPRIPTLDPRGVVETDLRFLTQIRIHDSLHRVMPVGVRHAIMALVAPASVDDAFCSTGIAKSLDSSLMWLLDCNND